MSKRSDPAAFARAAGAADPATLADPAPAPDPAPPESTALAMPADEAEDLSPVLQPYDSAGYRWVPVRRVPRRDGWTEEKQRRFIEVLADTGLVNVAAKAVGMSRETAYALRRAEHGAAFARAWDKAREHAAGLIEDIAFERAIEGTEREVLDHYGHVVATRLVHDNRLLQYLLSHLKPERYGTPRTPAAAPQAPAEPVPALADRLRDMEPPLPAPAEQLLDPDTLACEMEIADIADGTLPRVYNEQRTPRSDAQRKAEEAAARDARGAAAAKKQEQGGVLSEAEYADFSYHIDPWSNARPLPRRRKGAG
jgi:hypothetical protein